MGEARAWTTGGTQILLVAAANDSSILDRLRDIHASAMIYFDEALQSMPANKEERAYFDSYDRNLFETGYWGKATPELKRIGDELAGRLAAVAQETASTIARSPLLTEVDRREAGRAFKGMRAALRFLDFQFDEIEVLHDEGAVLGVQPPRESERKVNPADAKEAFAKWFSSLQNRLELADLRPNEGSEVSIGGARPIAAGYRPNTAFIMMWISKERPELEDVCARIKECFAKFGIKAVRADDIEHEDVITQQILDEIKTSEFLIADLTGERPSVYYEVGFAHALGRRVILYRKSGTQIHFDLAAYNCPEYRNLKELGDLLMRRLESMTGAPPKITAL